MDLQLFAQEKTEAATPKKREESRRKGQVFKSTEVVSAITLLTTYLILKQMGPLMVGRVLTYSRNLWEQGAVQDWSAEGVRLLMVNGIALVAVVCAPVLLGASVSGIAANLLQVGFLFTWEPLTPKFERINPAAGLKRLFSRRTITELVKSLFKMGVIGYVAYRTVSDDLESFPILLSLSLPQAATFLVDLVSRLLLWIGVTMLVMALVDYAYQRWEYEESIKMTKQEVKDENRQTDGNPEVRAKIRQKQREMARRRMMQDLPKADVVVTNPTHYAIALGYTSTSMKAPRILAKGQGFVAIRIRELAEEYGVSIVENASLARQLHQVTDVGQEVPPELYLAVAEVLAFVYQLKDKRPNR